MRDAHQPAFGTVFDADNHYWEASDAFTRHRDPKLGDRGLQVREINGSKRYVLGGQVFEGLPGPGDATLRPAPGAFLGYFVGKIKGTEFIERFDVEPADRPEWYNRDARLKVMDSQGVDACWLFPSQAVVLEAPMLATGDIEASVASVQAFNRWLDEDWGFAYQNRIFAVPYMTLSDPDIAAAEMKWAIERGARIVNLRHGPVVTRDGLKSPANIMFDRFWALAEEAQVTVSFHAGADYSAMQSYAMLREMYGEMPDGSNPEDKMGYMVGSIFPPMLKGRQIQDFAYILVAHRLFERFPKLRCAFVENGASWVPPLLYALEMLEHTGNYKQDPREQFIEHCWVVPYPEDDMEQLVRHIPTNRIMFGSDWPHGEGLVHPRDFFRNVEGLSSADVQRIMRDNARELTFA